MNVINFIHNTTWDDLPENVQHQARRCLLDTLGAGISGRKTELSRIIYDFADAVYGGEGAHLWLDGRELSPPGAALANGMTIDALDIHDGHPLVKGHIGAAIIPALFATLSAKNFSKKVVSGREFLTSLVIGYEIALRAGMALHATACDYHTSGAWNSLGCAAVTARRLGLAPTQTRHALGIAEYHGPRSQMMRCIDHPTMLKDGSGWGAMTGVSAAMMAQRNFTGAPPVTVEADKVQKYWSDLGKVWRINELYFKPHAVCRWAQPAIEGVLSLQQVHRINPEHINRIKIFTFQEATRLNSRQPQNTEEAQYSLPFPVAAALVYGKLGISELSGSAIAEAMILRLANCVELAEDRRFSDQFPMQRLARVQVETATGDLYETDTMEAKWDSTAPPTDQELRDKFRWLVHDQLSSERAARLEDMIWRCADLSHAANLLPLLTPPSALA